MNNVKKMQGGREVRKQKKKQFHYGAKETMKQNRQKSWKRKKCSTSQKELSIPMMSQVTSEQIQKEAGTADSLTGVVWQEK